MPSLFRAYSVLVRRRRAGQERSRILSAFEDWRASQRGLPDPRMGQAKLLVIRLDDIGDYLLFRNQLGEYKTSSRWRNQAVTLLGNASWKDIFTACDADRVDSVIWVDKNRYLIDAAYRWTVWTQLRAGGFTTVIAASRTRPLLLDDLCMRAAAPAHAIGSVNTYVHDSWNHASDALYQELFQPADSRVHEFHFNGEFTKWACGACYTGRRPAIDLRSFSPHPGSYIVCFVGANTRSKRWPLKRWLQFIKRYRRTCPDQAVIAGASPAEVDVARTLQQRTGALSIAGQVSLRELIDWVAGARAVITNDTMAAHLGVSCNRPTLIIANGVHHARFTDYEGAGIDGVATVYPDRFNRRRRRDAKIRLNYEDVVTADIHSIDARTVVERLVQLLGETPSA